MSDQDKEEIRFYTEILKLFSAALIADIGGFVALTTQSQKPQTIVFISASILFAVICTGFILNYYKLIKSKIE